MRISGGVLAIIVALAGAGCAPGRPAPPPRGEARYAGGSSAATPGAGEAGPASAVQGTASAPPGPADPAPGASSPGAGPVTGWPHVAVTSAVAEQARRLTVQLDRYLRKRPGRTSVAVYDRVTGLRYRYRERTPYRLADVAEIDILLALLLRGQERMNGLTPHERRLATRMIRFGDDRAAQRLYAVVGGRAGLTRTLRRLGIERTTPGPGRHWKHTRSVATDQLRVLDLLTSPSGPVNPRNRAFAAALLATDAPRRARGIGAATARRDRVALRNGRLRDAHGRWTVASAGRISSPSRDTLIAVLSDGSPGRTTGQATVERVASIVMAEVRRD